MVGIFLYNISLNIEQENTVGIFLHNISLNIEQENAIGIFLNNILCNIAGENTVGIFLYNIWYIGADDQSLIIHRPIHPKYTLHHSFHQL